MTINIDVGPNGYYVWNEYNLKTLTRNNWRASLVGILFSQMSKRISFVGRKLEMRTNCTHVNCRELLDVAPLPGVAPEDNLQPSS